MSTQRTGYCDRHKARVYDWECQWCVDENPHCPECDEPMEEDDEGVCKRCKKSEEVKA